MKTFLFTSFMHCFMYIISEAMIRFLKAKLRVLQEEHEQLTLELNQKVLAMFSRSSFIPILVARVYIHVECLNTYSLSQCNYSMFSMDDCQMCTHTHTYTHTHAHTHKH